MGVGRYSKSRQKACRSCIKAKAKCDRKAGGCGRCTLRALYCDFAVEAPSLSPSGKSDEVDHGPEVFSMSSDGPSLTTSSISPSTNSKLDFSPEIRVYGIETENRQKTDHSHSAIRHTHCTVKTSPFDSSGTTSASPTSDQEGQTLDFDGLDLLCPIDASAISNRWLNSYLPVEGQIVKHYPASIDRFIDNILKSYTAIAVHGRGAPPFVHPLQMTQSATRPQLSTCLSLVRICDGMLPGADTVATEVIEREMNRLYDQRQTYDELGLLASFQAYLIYALVLFFRLRSGSRPFLRQVLMNLQDLACATSQQGLMCTAERQGVRPRWEAWIAVEAKRRTLYTMYLFDNVLSTHDGLPTFQGTELQGLPASSNKVLWRARSRQEWEQQYNAYLASWEDGELRIEELWATPPSFGATELATRRDRVEKWLELVDEYGMMLYTVTSCTHGG